MFSGNLTLRQNKPFNVKFSVSGADAPATLTGYNLEMNISKSLGAAGPRLLEIRSDGANPHATVDAVNRTVMVSVPASVTDTIDGVPNAEAKYVSDARLVHVSNGDVVDLGSYRVNWEPKV